MLQLIISISLTELFHTYLQTAPILRYIEPWLLDSVRVYLAGLKLIVLTEARSDSLSSSDPPDKCDSRLAMRPERGLIHVISTSVLKVRWIMCRNL